MATTLIVPGLNDSPPGHWQSWFEEVLPDTIRVKQPDWGRPDLDAWAENIAAEIEACAAPPILVAHSFGVMAAVHAIRLVSRTVAGALLVAPADPDIFGYAEVLSRQPLPFSATLVASRSDPWMSFDNAARWADRWDARLIDHGHVAHINLDSGHGPWPAGLRFYRDIEKAGRRQLHPVGSWSVT